MHYIFPLYTHCTHTSVCIPCVSIPYMCRNINYTCHTRIHTIHPIYPHVYTYHTCRQVCLLCTDTSQKCINMCVACTHVCICTMYTAHTCVWTMYSMHTYHIYMHSIILHTHHIYVYVHLYTSTQVDMSCTPHMCTCTHRAFSVTKIPPEWPVLIQPNQRWLFPWNLNSNFCGSFEYDTQDFFQLYWGIIDK